MLLLNTLYTLYILLLYRLSVPLSISPGKPYITAKVTINALKSREPPEPVLLSHLHLAVHQTLRFPILQRLHVTNLHNNPMFLLSTLFSFFSKSHWRPPFSYDFDIGSSCHGSCDPSPVPKICLRSKIAHILMKFQCFYVSTSRCRFGKVIKNATDMFQHDVLKGAHVHEMTLCVTFGAPHFQTDFRSFTRCSKYAVIHMLLATHVLQTTLCVTFGARLRSVPLPLLGHLVAALAATSPRTPERPPQATIWAAYVFHQCAADLTLERLLLTFRGVRRP